MSTSSPESEPLPEPAAAAPNDRGRRWWIAAWVAVVLIPVLSLLASLVGEALASALGGDRSGATIGVMLGAGLPAIAVMLLAPAAAIICGVRARRHGRPLAIIPIIIGIIAAAWAVLINTLPLLLSGMLGA